MLNSGVYNLFLWITFFCKCLYDEMSVDDTTTTNNMRKVKYTQQASHYKFVVRVWNIFVS